MQRRRERACPEHEASDRTASVPGWHLVLAFPETLDAATASELLALCGRLEDFELEGTRISGLLVPLDPDVVGGLPSVSFGRLDPSHLPFAVHGMDPDGLRALGLPARAVSEAGAGRATWLIDADGRVRASLRYPYETARPVDELLRLTMALRSAETNDTLIPEGWKPGDGGAVPNHGFGAGPATGFGSLAGPFGVAS